MKSLTGWKYLLIVRALPPVLKEETLLGELSEAVQNLRRDENLAIHWNFPSSLFSSGSDDSFIPRLRERMVRTGDVILSAGALGTPHVFLSGAEVKREHEDAREFFKTLSLGGREKGWYFPFFPDFSRDELLRLYRKEEHFFYLGEGAEKRQPRIFLTNEKITLPVVAIEDDVTEFDRENFSKTFKEKSGTGIVLLDLVSPYALCGLKENLPRVVSILGGPDAFVSLKELYEGNHRELSGKTSHRQPAGPDLSSGISDRRGKFWKPSWREIFQSQSIPSPASLAPPGQNLIADMLGSVAMEGDDFTVHFEKGRLKGITRNRKPLIPKKPAGWGFTVDRSLLPVLPPAAYSFENHHIRGLREIQTFLAEENRRGRIVTDYCFSLDYPQLLISGTLEFPALSPGRRINAYKLLELTLFEAPERDFPLKVESGSTGRKIGTTEIGPVPGEHYLTGSSQTLILGDKAVFLGLPDGSSEQFILPLRIEKKRGRFAVLVNPWGSYFPLPAEELSDLREHFIFCLWAGSAEKIPANRPPVSAFPGEQGCWVGRHRG